VTQEITCPDLGDFKDVGVIEVLVKAGEQVEVETPLITLETDKATMDVPSPIAGKIAAVLVKKGDRISKGTPLVSLEGGEVAAAAENAPASQPPKGAEPAKKAEPEATPAKAEPAKAEAAKAEAAKAAAPKVDAPKADAPKADAPKAEPVKAESPKADAGVGNSASLLVLGSGPGGYTAAFRAADLGLKVTLVERWDVLGGVCLNVGCIPSKALLHAAKVIEETREMATRGIDFGQPTIDFDKLRAWKTTVVKKLTGGLTQLAKQRKVEVVRGTAKFVGPNEVEIVNGEQRQRIHFEKCIIAAGSEAVKLPFIPEDPRIIDSTGALELPPNPGRLLVIGGGIIGLEMACVYDALGAKVSVVELTPQLIPGCDIDLVRPLEKRMRARYAEIQLETKVTAVKAADDGVQVSFEAKDGSKSTKTYDHVLVAVGRLPNGKTIGAESAGVKVDARGFIPTDKQMRTNVPHIFAIGDIAGAPMLAHKATHEAKVAAEVAAGHKSAFDARVIPSVAYTDPEIAWVGLTEIDARARDIKFEKGVFPWAASGRSLSIARDEGITKLLVDPITHRVLGAGIVGPGAGELIAEVGLAIELGADAADIGLTVHAHPTLSETVAFAAEAIDGTLTDLYIPKKKAN
jgi:dihydrolipoamide dehydrogenase